MAQEIFPLADDMTDRLRAHGVVSDTPLEWTPEHVSDRIIEAFRTLAHAPLRVGPSAGGSGYPSILIAAAKSRDAWLRRSLPETMLGNLEEAVSHPHDEDGDEDRLPRYASDLPTSIDLSRMEEALAWPMRYLGDAPLQADALLLFCMGQAYRSFEIQPILRDRLEKARRLAWTTATSREDAIAKDAIERGADPDKESFAAFSAGDRAAVLAAERRRIIARAVAAETNKRIHERGSYAAAEERERAWKHYRRRVVEAGAAPEGFDDCIAAMPNACLFRWQVDRHRKRASATIAAGLRSGSIAIR